MISRQIGSGLASSYGSGFTTIFQVFAFANRETGNLNLPER